MNLLLCGFESKEIAENVAAEILKRGVAKSTNVTEPIEPKPPLSDADYKTLLDAEPMLKFFGFRHLTPAPAQVSEQFFNLAAMLVTEVPRNPERTVALRKLLEAKDCAVRAVL